MPPGGVVEQRRRPLQDRSRATVSFVLEAAAQLFSESGYHAVTTNAVAERAGVSIGTLYQYFANKDDLLMALLEHHVAAAKTAISTALRDLPASDVRSVIAELVRFTLAHNTAHPDLGMLMQRYAPRSTLLQDHLSETRRLIADAILNRLQATRRSLSERELRLRAELAARVIEQLSHSVALDEPVGESTDALSAEITRMVVGYLHAPPNSPDRVE
ncbi:TetR/AcrR family transcriptional regulator [Mycobacterium hodleri]|uniref:TetR/AcrR family transcriptional regulator n=1 Tax=Mycolicibacterium hodleri TaxID=49897 RepID=A0A502EE07_9MYCO|nr:TetR/AcrR family transcriptional regulator [Mycolicibacterium hodleri]